MQHGIGRIRMINFYEEKCQGCELCVKVCPKSLLFLNREKVNKRGHNPIQIANKEECTSCALCATMCPDCVIELEA